LLQEAGVKPNTMFLPFLDVEDATVTKLIDVLCRQQHLALQQVADAFGRYWVNVYSQTLYATHYKQHKTAKDLLLSMDEIHVKMTKTIKDARPPRFRYEWKDKKTLIMHYKSHRGLNDLLVGLVRGAGSFYREELQVKKIGLDKVEIVFPDRSPRA
jgi:hypothetical protein